MQLSFILEFFTQQCQQGWLLPCSRFSVSQNFCSSLKYLSRMYTFDVPIPAILTTGGHHWLSSALFPPMQASSAQIFLGASICFLLSHILETVMPAGRPSTGCSPMGRTTAPRQDPTVAQCTVLTVAQWHNVHQTQVGAHHSGALWHHLGARDPTAGGGWWQPLNPTWLKAGQTQKPVFDSADRRESSLWGKIISLDQSKSHQSQIIKRQKK